jgi:hypothetical protein
MSRGGGIRTRGPTHQHGKRGHHDGAHQEGVQQWLRLALGHRHGGELGAAAGGLAAAAIVPMAVAYAETATSAIAL